VNVNKSHQAKTALATSPAAKSAGNKPSIRLSTGYWVTRLARAMEAEFENRLGVHGVSRAACAILSAIRNDGKNTPAALASFIGIDPAAITRHLTRLEKNGLLVREQSTTDRRSVNLRLTRKGSRLLPKLIADSKATNAKFLTGLRTTEKETLHELIQKMLANSDLVPGDI